MVFSNLMNRSSLYETEVMQIRIEPELQMPASSLRSSSDDTDSIIYFGRSTDNIFLTEDANLFALPGCVEDEVQGMNSNNWMGSFQQLEEPAPQPVFNLLPNGRRKKSFRAKIKNFFSGRGYYRRAAYAVDSKTTKFGDSFATSATKLKTLLKSSMERLTMPEPSWADFDNIIFSGGNMSLIPFPMHQISRL